MRLTIQQIVELGITRQWVHKKIASREWDSQESGRRGRNGKPIREVLLSSLPEELQFRWAQLQKVNSDDSETESDTQNADQPLPELTRLLSRYSKDLRDAYIAEINRLNNIVTRYASINPKRMRNDHGKLVYISEVIALCCEAVCSNPLILEREPKRADVPSPHTVEGWFQRRKKIGLAVFLRPSPKVAKRGDKRIAGFSPDAYDWFNDNWRNYPTQSHCIKKLRKLAKQKKWKVPSNSTLRRILSSIPPVVKARAFGTDKDYTSKWKPFLPRVVEDLAPLQIVCGDHHLLDVVAWSKSLQSLVRLWLTVWQDLRTGLIWGYHLDYTPSSHTIACAYANGVRTFGAQPFSRSKDGFKSYGYTDNGKDYKGRNVKGEIVVHKRAAQIDGGLQLILTAHSVGLLNEAGVEQMLANLYNGREKPVERTFNDLATSIQNDFFKNGWCGRNTKDKPDAYRELYARHIKANKQKRPSPFPAEQEVRDYIADWVVEYNTSEHTRSTLDGATVVPLTDLNRLYTTRYEISEEALALMLLKPAKGTIGKNGVDILGATYVHEALSRYKGVKGSDGKLLKIEARYSDEQYSTIWLVLPNGDVVEATRLDRSPILNPNRESQRLVATLTKHEAKLAKDFNLLAHSRLRGESTEDRAVALIKQEEAPMAELPLAVNGEWPPQGRVQRLTRFDGKKLRAAAPQKIVTAEEVAEAEVDASIFNPPRRARVKLFDGYDDEEEE